MHLRPETVERVRAYWRGWQEVPAPNFVSVVVIGEDRFVSAPEPIRIRFGTDVPTTLGDLVEILGDAIGDRSGEARLSYADDQALHVVDIAGVQELSADDSRLAERAAASDPAEWSEGIGGEARQHHFGYPEQGPLLAVANLQRWNDQLGHVGVFTAAPFRGRGLSPRVACAAAQCALAEGLVPQWRAAVGNDASIRVTQKLGFVELGTQIFARIKSDGEDRRPSVT